MPRASCSEQPPLLFQFRPPKPAISQRICVLRADHDAFLSQMRNECAPAATFARTGLHSRVTIPILEMRRTLLSARHRGDRFQIGFFNVCPGASQMNRSSFENDW